MDLTQHAVKSVRAMDRVDMDGLTAGKSIFVGYPHVAAIEGDAGLDRNHLVAGDGDGCLMGVLPTYLADGEGSWKWDHFVRYIACDGAEAPEGWYPILLGCPRRGSRTP